MLGFMNRPQDMSGGKWYQLPGGGIFYIVRHRQSKSLFQCVYLNKLSVCNAYAFVPSVNIAIKDNMEAWMLAIAPCSSCCWVLCEYMHADSYVFAEYKLNRKTARNTKTPTAFSSFPSKSAGGSRMPLESPCQVGSPATTCTWTSSCAEASYTRWWLVKY